MTKKPFPTDALTNELAGASAFFQPQATKPPAAASLPSPLPSPPPALVADKPVRQQTKKAPSQIASVLASYQQELVEIIRRTVKKGGRIVSFVRLTQTEKDQLADIVYTYKRRGMKTTENEINRIAINFLLEDYKRNGEASMLVKVIEALLA